MNFFFFGSDKFSLYALKALLSQKNTYKNLFVYTTNTHSKKNPVSEFCKNHNINHSPIFTFSKTSNLQNFKKIKNLIKSDFKNEKNINLTCSFKLMIPSFLINTFHNNNYVVHPSILPKYRGSSPIHAALLNGDKYTGVSIVGMSKKKFDAGEIFLQKDLKINENWRYPDLYKKLGDLSTEVVEQFFDDFDFYEGNGKKQIIVEPGLSKKLQKGDNLIFVKDFFIEEIVNKYKGFFGSTLKGVNFLSKNEKFVVTDLIHHKKSIDEIFKLDNCFLNKFFVIGQAVDGMFNYKKSFFIKGVDGWLEIKSGFFTNKGNFSFNQTKSYFFEAEIRKGLKEKIIELKKDGKIDIEGLEILIKKLRKFE